MNKTLVVRAKCMLFDAQLAKQFWAEALATAAYIINRSPTKSINGKTPMEIWTGKKRNLSNLKIPKNYKNKDLVFLENVGKYNNDIYLPCTSNSNSPGIQPPEEICKEELKDSMDRFTANRGTLYGGGRIHGDGGGDPEALWLGNYRPSSVKAGTACYSSTVTTKLQ
ncbi:Retrovirus-related Pol polyprotein from transposon TNT 1-94 [Eumeta japonica]|uniref:Retrovirus-related Pol polyprotein from transposon TNT 1-94 n=1 Tax=Eumeta variegata TaxID=151549 RepID=A0A4C1Z3P8_EUMVA|nr:Retrovirus-related Pol polyprotein from transposon TNT 1-94 [Eumeta japonica]